MLKTFFHQLFHDTFQRKESLVLLERAKEDQRHHRFYDARTKLLNSLQIYPLPETYKELSLILSKEGLMEEAIDLCKAALDLDPDLAEAYSEIGRNLVLLNRYEEAVDWLKVALDNPALPKDQRQLPHFQLGQIYFAQGKTSEAKEQFLAVLRHQPGNHGANRFLAQLEKRKKISKL